MYDVKALDEIFLLSAYIFILTRKTSETTRVLPVLELHV